MMTFCSCVVAAKSAAYRSKTPTAFLSPGQRRNCGNQARFLRTLAHTRLTNGSDRCAVRHNATHPTVIAKRDIGTGRTKGADNAADGIPSVGNVKVAAPDVLVKHNAKR